MRWGWILLALIGCSDASRDGGATDMAKAAGHDMAVSVTFDLAGRDFAGAPAATVVINEAYPNGPSTMDPDWIELYNTGGSTVDVGGYQIRDSKAADLTPIPSGTAIPSHGFLVIYCDDQSDGGIVGGVHVPFKLSGSKGDEVHLVDTTNTEVDATSFMAADVMSGKSWGRLPDGSGNFATTTPTKGAANMM